MQMTIDIYKMLEELLAEDDLGLSPKEINFLEGIQHLYAGSKNTNFSVKQFTWIENIWQKKFA